MTPVLAAVSARLLRHSAWDALFVVLSAVHGALLLLVPSVLLVGIGLWWNANTIAHNFIHRPFFRARAANRAYSAFLSLVLGVPQSVWRERHLAHHADRPPHLRWSRDVVGETLLVWSAWTVAAFVAPHVFFLMYLPGWALGLALCFLQGYYEHAGGTTSHYGRIYNVLFFNDGYHVEHHAQPGEHWLRLGRHPANGRTSRWPPVLRWLEAFSLDGLERLVLRSPACSGSCWARTSARSAVCFR
jgi:fatty acid desaturase